MANNLLMFDSRSTISGTNAVVNTWHIRTAGALTNAEATALMNVFKTFWDAIAAYRVPPTSVTTGARILHGDTANWVKPIGKPGKPGYVKGYWTSPPVIIAGTSSTSITGTGSGGLPPQLASVISWRTFLSGRTGRGRTYIGNLGGSAMNGAVIAAAYVAAVNTASANLISGVAAVPVASGVCGLTIWSPTTGLTHDVISGVSDATWDTMRSRVK
jgi:hypothetical protein